MKLTDLAPDQRQKVKGLVDASIGCAGRKAYFKFAEQVGLLGAIGRLREFAETNQATVDILENYLRTIGP